MNYKNFKRIVTVKIKDYLPEQYKDSDLIFKSISKINQDLDGICLNMGANQLSPTIYINNMYEEFLCCNDLQKTLKNAVATLVNASRNTKPFSLNIDMIKRNITYMFINTERNKELLKNIPHRDFLDLSVIYTVIVSGLDDKEDCIGKITITNDIMNTFGLNEQKLFNMAATNAPRIFPLNVEDMQDVMNKIYEDVMNNSDKCSVEDLCSMTDIIENTSSGYPKMLVVSNQKRINGAIAIMYKGVLDTIADIFNSDIYIMPSSIHEVIVVSTNDFDASFASEISIINENAVQDNEILSDNMYLYNRKTRQISIV